MNKKERSKLEIGDLIRFDLSYHTNGEHFNWGGVLRNYDFGIVVALKEPKFPFKDAKWLVEVYWQKFIPKSKSLIYHVRLKKVRVKKGKNK